MNHNQRLEEYLYRKQCRRVFDGFVSFIDKLFKGDMSWIEQEEEDEVFIPNVMKAILGEGYETNWNCQINRVRLPEYIDKYCEPSYYGLLMSDKIREYYLKKRIDK